MKLFETLPDFIKDKIKTSEEFKKIGVIGIESVNDFPDDLNNPVDDLPF